MRSWREKPCILIVDDDDDFMSDLKILLSSEFDVHTAADTRKAWEILEEYCPDCMLLDLHMPEYFGDSPGQEGLSFLQHIRSVVGPRCGDSIPVIVVSAFRRAGSAGELEEYGIRSVFRKPPDINRLKASIWDLVVDSKGNQV